MDSADSLFRGRSFRRLAGIAGLVVAGVGLVSDVLGLRGNDAPETVVITIPITSERSQAVDTTVVEQQGSGDPEVALEELRLKLAARSSSGLIDECGLHAVLATISGVRVYEWNGTEWQDFSNSLEVTTSAAPIGIQLLAATEASGRDVMVTFDRDGTRPPSGGVVTLGSDGCDVGFVWKFFAKSDGSFSRTVENLRALEDGGFESTTKDGQRVKYVWDDTNRLYAISASGESSVPVDPGVAVQPEVVTNFVENYSRFSTDSFETMLRLTERGSPAEKLVQFLLLGKRISRDAGYGEGSGFEFVRESNGYRIMAPGGGTLLTGFSGSGGLIGTFNFNSIPLERLIRIDGGTVPTQRKCSTSGVCIGVRGIQLASRTVYFALEVDGSQTMREVKLREAFLESTAGSQRHIGATTPQVSRRPDALWSLAFPLSDLPWGGRLTVVLNVGGVPERLEISLDS